MLFIYKWTKKKKLGEGCFYVTVNSDPSFKTAYRVKAAFHIAVHIRNIALLEKIKSFFGLGKISKLGVDTFQYRVDGFEKLKVIMNHFDKYPLLTSKQSDYLLFKLVVNDKYKGNHLTTSQPQSSFWKNDDAGAVKGLNKIISIKAVMNTKKV